MVGRMPPLPPSVKFPVNTPLDWALAFSTYSAVATHFHPDKAAELITYGNIILRLVREVKGKVCFRYDWAFRQTAAIQPSIRWDRREPDVWLAAMSEDNRTSDESTTSTPGAVPSEPSANRRKRPADDDICQRFNRRECPRSNKAGRLAHKCLICWSMSHGARDCPILLSTRRRPSTSSMPKEGEQKDNWA